MVHQVLPLTNSQLLIWTGQQLVPDQPIYNMGFHFRIRGAVDESQFRDAFRYVVQSSDAMRSVIELRNGVPVQRILSEKNVDSELDCIDLSGTSQPLDEALVWCDQRCRQLFSLDRPMFDAVLLRLAEDDFIFYLCMHHLIADAVAFEAAFQRLAFYYANLSSGNPNDRWFVDQPQFAEFVQACHASDRLSDPAPDENCLPEIYGRPNFQNDYGSSRVTCGIDSDLLESFTNLATRKKARSISSDLSRFNLFATLLFAFLHRISGQRNLTIGAPFHNRSSPDYRRTIGLFMELFVVTVDIDAEETFLSLLQKVRTASNRFLQKATRESPQATDNFNAVFNFITTSFGCFNGHEVETEWLHPGCCDKQHVLRMHVQQFDRDASPTIKFDLNDQIFGDKTSKFAQQHFHSLLQAMTQDWNQQISDVDLPDADELAWQRHQFTGVSRPEFADQSVIELFGQQAAHHPQRIAISVGDTELDYASLDQWSTGVAATLHENEVAKGTRVIVALPRSADFVVAVLGVLKTGATFIPVDPNWPETRIRQVIEQSAARMMIASPEIHPGLGNVLPRMEVPTRDASAAPLEIASIQPDDNAYILFTSGSSGQPKGVEIRHRSIANYACWARDFYCGDRQLVFPLFTPVTFDLTLTSIFVPLISGGTIVVYPRTNAHADVALLDVFEEDRVDIIKLTPAHLGLLEERQQQHSRVKQLIFGGENLTTGLARQAQCIFGNDVLIHNEYGPTEATVGCVVHTFDPQRDVSASVPIGLPIANMQAWVLDKRMRPVPTGLPGQLCVSGAGLAAGYVDQPEMTGEKFVSSPWDSEQKIYLTGDLARLDRAGQIEFMGRMDDQVKILGARIELGEVESALARHPSISTAVANVVPAHAQQLDPDIFCQRCGLASNYPGVQFDDNLICNQCRAFDSYRQRADAWFKSLEDFRALFADVSSDSPYDCVALLSGGKDSTYMLGQLVDMGLRVLAFTLDNGFISDEAQANIRRVVSTLNVDHVFGSTESMNEIFVDSLQRHSNVCHGCFKTIYTLSTKLALDRGIPFIVTGLSRGQFFETRLTEEVFTSPAIDAKQIDQTVLDARKAYHRIDDAVSRCLDVSALQQDETFEKVRYLDFYRYCPVELDSMYEYLDQRLPWVRPSDTGRSTNCLINDVGIYVHKREKGFHNYALPYSWDVRLGHKTRDAAIDELDDEIDVENVHRILRQIGYDDWPTENSDRLVAWYVSERELPIESLREHLATQIPAYMIPSYFVRVDSIPLTENRKVDRHALPMPGNTRQVSGVSYVPPKTDLESRLANIWSGVLGNDKIGIHDNFFDLGGDSILAIQIVARSAREGISLQPSDLFDAPTVAGLAEKCRLIRDAVSHDQSNGAFTPTPIQHWYLDHQLGPQDLWNQSVVVSPREPIAPEHLQQALEYLVRHHDAFRQHFSGQQGGWSGETVNSAKEVYWKVVNAGDDEESVFDEAESDLHAALTIESGVVLGGVLFRRHAEDHLLLAANHLAVDAVSWTILIDDLAQLCQQVAAGKPLHLDDRVTWRHWANHLHQLGGQTDILSQVDYWQTVLKPSAYQPESNDPLKVGELNNVKGQLNVAETRYLLETLPNQARASIDELLIAAVSKAIAEYSGDQGVRLFVERHGREPGSSGLDVSRTIGWFTTISPITIRAAAGKTPGDYFRETKETLRSIPNKGLGYGLLQYGNSGPADSAIRDSGRSGILFNYLGVVDSNRSNDGFRYVRPLRLHRSGASPAYFAWQINALIVNDQLTISLDSATSADIVERTFSILRDWSRPGVLSAGNSVSATDFPLANLDAGQLGKLSSLLRNEDSGRVKE